MKTFQRIIIGVLGVLLLVVAVQAMVPRTTVIDPEPPPVQEACKGTPIVVDYPYEGEYIDDWACERQCEDGLVHYVQYSNGKTTQCEPLPGCNDLGEDRGIECILEDASPEA